MNWLASACIVLSLAAVQQPHSKEHAETAQPEKKQTTPAAPEKAAGDATKAAKASEPHQDNPAAKSPPAGKDVPRFQWKPDVGVSDAVAALALIVGSLTLVVTAAFLKYTIKTWKEMVRANNDAEKRYEESKGDIEKSLKMTRDGQTDTRRAVGIAEKQLYAIINVTRASVTIESITPINAASNVRIIFKNSGLSVARKVFVHLLFELSPNPPIVDPQQFRDVPLTRGCEEMDRDGPFTVDMHINNMTDDRWQAYREKTSVFHVYGMVFYNDVFGLHREITIQAQYFNPKWVITKFTSDELPLSAQEQTDGGAIHDNQPD